MGQPAVEGTGLPATNTFETPLKAGEFILGYPDETGSLPPMPYPDVLGHNGTYIAFVKLHTQWRPFEATFVLLHRARTKKHSLPLRWSGAGKAERLVLSPESDDGCLDRFAPEQCLSLRR